MDAQPLAAQARPRRRPDADILAEVEEVLWEDPIIRALDRNSLKVAVQGGEVTIWGHVASSVYRGRLDSLIEGVPGVTAIHDEVVADLELSTAVAQALAADPRTSGHVIRVGVFHGWVRLSGRVPDAVAEAAEEVAASVPHVRGVLAVPRSAGSRKAHDQRRPFQPRLGAEVYASDGQVGKVSQVAINPRSRLVSDIAVQARMETAGRTVTGEFVEPAEAIDWVSDGGVFLMDSSEKLAERPPFREEDFPPAPADWIPPFPYEPGTLRWRRTP